MKLVTFQTMEALQVLVRDGVLTAGAEHVNRKRSGAVYDWVLEQMERRIPGRDGAAYPIWCWVRFKNGICPPKRRGKPVKGFDVKITFRKPEEEVFVTDYRRFSFLLNNRYLPESTAEGQAFDRELARYGITNEELMAYIRPDRFPEHRQDGAFLELCSRIRGTFDRCITTDSDVLQGCVWRLELKDVEFIELLHDDGYCYGSFNYVRSNGRRFDWIGQFYEMLRAREEI